jgi:hypothetical protein
LLRNGLAGHLARFRCDLLDHATGEHRPLSLGLSPWCAASEERPVAFTTVIAGMCRNATEGESITNRSPCWIHSQSLGPARVRGRIPRLIRLPRWIRANPLSSSARRPR